MIVDSKGFGELSTGVGFSPLLPLLIEFEVNSARHPARSEAKLQDPERQ